MTPCILVIQPGEQGGTPWACLESGPPSPLLPSRQTSAMNNHPLCQLPCRHWRLRFSWEQSLQNMPALLMKASSISCLGKP